MHRIRRVTDSVRVRVTVLATFLVAVVLVVGALLLTRAVERRLVNDRQRAVADAVGTTVDAQCEQPGPGTCTVCICPHRPTNLNIRFPSFPASVKNLSSATAVRSGG